MGHLKSTAFGLHENPIGFRFALFVPEIFAFENRDQNSQFSHFWAITPEPDIFWTCGFHQKVPNVTLHLLAKNQKNPTRGLEAIKKLVIFHQILKLLEPDFRSQFSGWRSRDRRNLTIMFRKIHLSTFWKSNRISICSFGSGDIRVWKVVPKGLRPTLPLTWAQISREPDFSQTCGFHHELEKG